MSLTYGSVASGVEAATLAWEPLGMKPAWFSEIDAFPSAVLAHHYPSVPNLGDVLTLDKHKEYNESIINVLVGGTPCQSFSIAGLRKGMDDPRGNLSLAYLGVADRKRPNWLVWENVPGVLSSSGGRDFGAFLAGLGNIGYGWAYRVLNAQYFGTPQRRRRVFVVGCLGDWRGAAAVLFERHSLSGNPPPGREAGKGAASGAEGSPDRSSDHADRQTTSYRTSPNCGAWETGQRVDALTTGTDPTSHIIAQSKGYRMAAFGEYVDDNTASTMKARDYKDATDLVMYNVNHSDGRVERSDTSQTLIARMGTGGNQVPLVLNDTRPIMKGENGKGWNDQNVAFTLNTVDHPGVLYKKRLRKLLPLECERLQGMPDNYTLVPYRGKPASACPDSPRYKAIGNSMAVPVMQWIGQRIIEVDNLMFNTTQQPTKE